MKCPKCLCPDVYRNSPLSLQVYCLKCGWSWKARQSLKPFLVKEVYSKKAPKGKHKISVWCCPLDSEKYSFQITYGQGIMRFDEFSSNSYLSGIYDTPEEALKAGVKKVYG